MVRGELLLVGIQLPVGVMGDEKLTSFRSPYRRVVFAQVPTTQTALCRDLCCHASVLAQTSGSFLTAVVHFGAKNATWPQLAWRRSQRVTRGAITNRRGSGRSDAQLCLC